MVGNADAWRLPEKQLYIYENYNTIGVYFEILKGKNDLHGKRIILKYEEICAMATPVLKIDPNQKNKLDAGFAAAFGGAPDRYFSAPGRTEIGGNHTDHQRGRVLAAAVNLDTVAALPVRFCLLYPTNCSIPSAPGWTVCWGKVPAMCCAFVRRSVWN